MKERIKNILGGLFLIVVGVVAWLMADEYVLMLFGVIEVDFRIFGGIMGVIGLISLIVALLPKKNKAAQPAPQYLQDKHYFRKHGEGAYYGQK